MSSTVPSDDELSAAVENELETSDMDTVSRKQLIADLEAAHNWDISSKKVLFDTYKH